MPEVTQNTIAIQVKADGVDTAVKGLSSLVDVLKKLKEVGDTTNKVTSEVTEATVKVESLGKALKGLLNVAGITAAAKAISGYVKSSMDYVEDVNLFTVSMGQFTDKAYEYAQTVSSIMGIDPGQWMRNQGTFMNIAHGFGVASDRAYIMSQQLTQLGYDLSSLFNIPVDQAMAKLGSGIAGELEPLRRIGYDLSKASLEAIALELGITKSYNAMTQAEKAQLRYYAIMTQVTVAQGDMARTLEAPANQLRILQMQFEMTARAIGNIFIPILNAVMPVVVAVVKVIRMAAESIAALFGYTLPEMNWETLTDATTTVADNMDDAYGSAKKLKKQLAGFDEINNLTTPEPSGGGRTPTSGGWVDFELPTYDFLGDAVSSRVEELVAKLTPLLDIIKAILPVLIAISSAFVFLNLYANIATGNFGALGESLKNTAKQLGVVFGEIAKNPTVLIIAGIIAVITYLGILYATNEDFRNRVNEIIQNIVGWVKTAVANIKEFVANLWENLKQFWESVKTTASTIASWINTTVIQPIIRFFTPLFTWLKGAVQGVVTFVSSTIQALITIIAMVVNSVYAVLQAIAPWVNEHVITPIADFFSGLWQNIVNSLVGAWNGIKDFFTGYIKWMKDQFSAAWDWILKMFNSGGQIFTGITAAVGAIFKQLLNYLIGGINAVISTPFRTLNWLLDKIRNASILGFKPFENLGSISIPQIPKLAQGGVVTRSTIANIGENGPEAIVPLRNNTQWIDSVSAQLNENSTNDEVVTRLDAILQAILGIDTDVQVDIVELTNAVRKQEKKQMRIQGV